MAALKHPIICTPHDVEPDYPVMEYIAGSELKGPLPLEKAVELRCQTPDCAQQRVDPKLSTHGGLLQIRRFQTALNDDRPGLR